MSTLVERHIPCPMCDSSNAFCTYSDGHGYCFSCHRRRKYATIANEETPINNKKGPKW